MDRATQHEHRRKRLAQAPPPERSLWARSIPVCGESLICVEKQQFATHTLSISPHCGLYAAPSLCRLLPAPRAVGEQFRAFAALPSQHVALNAPGESTDCAHPVLRRRGSPSSSALLDSALSTPHFNPRFTWNPLSGVSWFSSFALQPAELLASLADLTRHSLLCPANRGFYFRAFGRVGRPSRRRIYLRWHLGTSTDRTLTCWNGS